MAYTHCKKQGVHLNVHTTLTVCCMTGSANHPNKSLISTPTVSNNTPLVWYALFIFYSAALAYSY